MTPTKAEELSDWLFAFASGKAESIMLCRAAAELRRLSAVEAERDALQRKVQEMALQALADDTQHREVEAERDALLSALLKEARKIIRASSSRSLAKDWDRRATQALAGATTGEQHG